MHELSVCLSLLTNVERIAVEHDAVAVSRIVLTVGPLSGIEPDLLERAWPLAASGTLAEQAVLHIDTTSVVIRCESCGTETTVQPNRLLCGRCNDGRTRVISGQEMFLTTLELEKPDVSGDTNENSERGRLHGQV